MDVAEIKPPKNRVWTHQPTHRLNPKKPFSVETVEKILQQIIDNELAEVEYNEKAIPELCTTLAGNIRDAVKEQNYDRCRLIVALSIGQLRQQSTHVYHAFLWDYERDNFAYYNFHNYHIYANAVVYAVYLD